MDIERASGDDLAGVLRLLQESRLPTDGLARHLATAFVTRAGSDIVGCAALEVYPDGALLRSVAVAPQLQGRGLGGQLTDAAIALARSLNLPALYLLTTTADRYFPRFGFERIARSDVPPGVQTSVEFSGACPSSATVMRKVLEMRQPLIRPAVADDLPALTAIYNHYITHTAITFDLRPLIPEERRAWFDEHAATGRHRLLVALDDGGKRLGYASTSRWRAKAAYDTTVEASVYCDPAAVGRGCGSALYRALFDAIAGEDINRIVAGISLPNPASVRLHERFGFQPVGVFHGVGRKFDRYWDVAWFERPLVL